MWRLMSRDGPELLIGDISHLRESGLCCQVLAIFGDIKLVRVRLDDGGVMECAPAALDCYLMETAHPGE